MQIIFFRVFAFVVVVLLLRTPALAQPLACEGALLGSFGGYTQAMASEGDLAYLASGGGGLMIVDAGDAANPVYVGALRLDGVTQGIAVRDSIVCLSLYDAPTSYMVVVDATDPSAPVEIGRVEVPRIARQLVLREETVYIACEGFGLQLVDVSVPSDPALLGALPTQGDSYGVEVLGDLAYIADTQRLVIADVSDGANPAVVSQLEQFDRAYQVAGSGDGFVYVSDRGLRELIGVDVRDPEAPAIIGQAGPIATPSAMTIRDGHVYLASIYDGIFVVDVRNPAAMAIAGAFGRAGLIDQVGLLGEHLMASGAGVDLALLDITSPLLVEEVGRLEIPNDPRAVAAHNGRVVIADHSDGLRVVDLSDPASPRVVSTLELPGQTYDMRVVGDLAYMSCGAGLSGGSLRIVDLSDHDNPQLIGVAETSDRVLSAVIDGPWAYIAMDDYGFGVVDISYPANPEVVYTRETRVTPLGMAVRDGVLYITEGTRGIRIYDVSRPAYPELVGASAVLSDPREILIRGDHAFVMQWFQGMAVLDLSEPLEPRLVAEIDNNTIVTSTRPMLFGDAVYICGGNLGVLGVDISDPANPVEFAHLRGMPRAFALTVDGPRMYVAGIFTGVHTLELSGCPTDCRADFDLSGLVDIQDVVAFVTAHTGGDLHADFNADGRLNFFDVSAFLHAFNAGCP